MRGVLVAGLTAVSFAAADTAPRHPALLDDRYAGLHPEAFRKVHDQLRWQMRTLQLEVSAALGFFRYQEGFRYPLTVRFSDETPPGREHALAYVRLFRSLDGFSQELVVNVAALDKPLPDWLSTETILRHEMTHAALNDAAGGDAGRRLPPWLHEGLAQRISKEGEPRLKDAAGRYYRAQIRTAPVDVRRPPAQLAYPIFFLAVRFLEAEYGLNAVQRLVQQVLEGRPVDAALRDITAGDPERFYGLANEYARRELIELAVPDGTIRGVGI